MYMVCFMDKNKACELKSKGFTYTVAQIDNQTVYQFIKTPELEKYLANHYSKQDFFVNKNFCM